MIEPIPLIVDLDGTLIAGDTLHLSLRSLVQTRPWIAPLLPFVVFGGRARFKAFLSDHVKLNPVTLPYRTSVVDFVKTQRGVRARVVLATAAHRSIAEAVSNHLGLFDAVIATDGTHNAKGDGKLASIREHLGDSDFDYVGDSMADVPVFRAARRSYLVCPSASLAAVARNGCRVEAVFQ